MSFAAVLAGRSCIWGWNHQAGGRLPCRCRCFHGLDVFSLMLLMRTIGFIIILGHQMCLSNVHLCFYCFLLGGYFCRYKQCFPRHNIEILELTESALFKKLLAGAPSFQMLRNIHPCVQAFSICWRGGEAAMAGLTKWRPASASALPSTACSAACSASALLLYRCAGALQELCYFY